MILISYRFGWVCLVSKSLGIGNVGTEVKAYTRWQGLIPCGSEIIGPQTKLFYRTRIKIEIWEKLLNLSPSLVTLYQSIRIWFLLLCCRCMSTKVGRSWPAGVLMYNIGRYIYLHTILWFCCPFGCDVALNAWRLQESGRAFKKSKKKTGSKTTKAKKRNWTLEG